MFHPKVRSPYEAKFINFKYPIFAGANFRQNEGLSPEDFVEYMSNARRLSRDELEQYYQNIISEYPSINPDELRYRLFHPGEIRGRGPIIESVPTSPRPSRQVTRASSFETIEIPSKIKTTFKPKNDEEFAKEVKKVAKEKIAKKRESAEKRGLKEAEKYLKRSKTTREGLLTKELEKGPAETELERERRELEEEIEMAQMMGVGTGETIVPTEIPKEKPPNRYRTSSKGGRKKYYNKQYSQCSSRTNISK